MKMLLFIVVIVLGTAMLGWWSYAGSQDKASITIDKNKVKSDTAAAVDETKEFAKDVKDKAEEVVDDVKQNASSDDDNNDAGLQTVPDDEPRRESRQTPGTLEPSSPRSPN